MTIEVHLYTQSEPIRILDVRNAYQKGDLYCVMMNKFVSTDTDIVYKFPLQHIFRIKETNP